MLSPPPPGWSLLESDPLIRPIRAAAWRHKDLCRSSRLLATIAMARVSAGVRAALHGPPSGGRRGRALRSELVQPRRRRKGNGILHGGSGETVSGAGPAVREIH